MIRELKKKSLLKKTGDCLFKVVGITVLFGATIVLILPYTIYQGCWSGPDPKRRKPGEPIPVFNL